MVKHRSRSVPSLFMIAQLGLAAAACGPSDAPTREKLGVSTEATNWESAKEGWKKLSGLAKTLGGTYSNAKGAVDVALFLGELLGFIESQPSLQDQLTALQAKIESEAQDLDFRHMQLERNMYFGGVHSAFSEALQTDVAGGARLPRQSGYNPQSSSALDSAGGEPMFHRRFSEQATAGPWKNILVGINQPPIYPGNVVFDWRLSVPWYLTMVSMRLSVMAAVDPEFTMNHSFDVELNDIRSRLERVRRLMVQDVRCQALYRYAVRQDLGVQVYDSMDVACADVNTGVSAVSSFPGCTTPGCFSIPPSEAEKQSRLDDLRREVINSMPLFEVDAMIDTLYHYTHPETLDLTQHWSEQITLEARQDLCLDAAGIDSGAPMRLLPCTFANTQWWQYDRRSGRIFNPAIGRCLELRPDASPAVMARAGAAAQIGDCADPLPLHQQWSYDRQGNVLRNGFNTVLDVQWGSLVAGTPVWLWDENGGAAQQWHAQQPHGLHAAWPTACGLLKPGEGLFNEQEATSCDGTHKLRLEANGNLNLYKRVTVYQYRPWPLPPLVSYRFDVVWSSGTPDVQGKMLIMRTDGNLVLYNFMEAPIWSSNTSGRPGAVAEIRNDTGLLVSHGGQVVWSR
jgi:hypothetical protein